MKLSYILTLSAAAVGLYACGSPDSIGHGPAAVEQDQDAAGNAPGTGGTASEPDGGGGEPPAGPCDNVRCAAPNCDPSTETEVTPPGECCAQCAPNAPDCSAVSCLAVECQPGEIAETPPGECCAQCVNPNCAAVSCLAVECQPGEEAETPPGECCPVCVPSVDCSLVLCAAPGCDPSTETPVVPPGECCPVCMPANGGIACIVDGERYESGDTQVPDPFSCNTCTCDNGDISACTEIGCPEPCPAGTTAGSRCDACGPAGGCMGGVVTGCLPACTTSADCSAGLLCLDGVCTTACI